MAEDEDIEMEEEESEGSGKFPIKWIIIGVVALLLVGGGIFGWMMVKKSPGDKPPEKTGTETVKEKKTARKTTRTSAVDTIFPMESFIVNLSDPGGKRFLKTKIDIELIRPDFMPDLSAKLPQLRDTIILFLSSKTVEDLQGIDGKIVLKNELITRINAVLGRGKIRNLYFTEFIVQ